MLVKYYFFFLNMTTPLFLVKYDHSSPSNIHCFYVSRIAEYLKGDGKTEIQQANTSASGL